MSMADFQKVVPLVVKKHLLYDGKFLGSFWPLTAYFVNFCQISQSTKKSAVLMGISQVGLLHSPPGHIQMVPNGFLGAPAVKNIGKNAREQHFKLLEIYPPPCPPVLVVLAAGGSIVQGTPADFCYDQMALNDSY